MDNNNNGATMDEAEIRKKRVLYRCHHTGMKENNLLLGAFATRHLPGMPDEDVAWFETMLLKQNDLDIFNWITGREPLPADLDHPVMRALLQFRLTA